MTSLGQFAKRCESDVFFAGYRLAKYAANHDLDDARLAERLGCDLDALAMIKICRAPRSDEDVLETADLIAARHGVAARVLAEMLM